ncbi:chemotaxis protein CheB [Vibrio nitrifigilis]|uniref:Protein-glutamate methylesterase/protein-glutamine glutaminase n=1 Tax=Vibrio nitrifigilis TaxID=2789781 RepID=A0ABS0GD97_9VIBR|nr:chemotaxis protein CheB [Vibrio nitrifigilis]MBF9000391.1 chemotaxis protein CheB [Vibrio nitrifigilis]
MKILVVDDSALMRHTITDILSDLPGAEIQTSRDGVDALHKLNSWQPDVITLDMNMPNMDGMTCLSHIMSERPTPVIVISSLTEEGALVTLEALYLGAVDYVCKPGGTVCNGLHELEHTIKSKVLNAVTSKVTPTSIDASPHSEPLPPAKPVKPGTAAMVNRRGLTIIGVSTGGPGCVERLARQIPTDYPQPVVVCQHMPESFTEAFAKRLDKVLDIPVHEISGATELKAGQLYICKGDRDCIVTERNGKIVALPTPLDNRFTWHPSVAKLVESAHRSLRADGLICVMMTGLGDDGAEEMAKVAQDRGIVLAQEPHSCVVDSMPKSLIKRCPSVTTAPPEELGRLLYHRAKSFPSEVSYGVN